MFAQNGLTVLTNQTENPTRELILSFFRTIMEAPTEKTFSDEININVFASRSGSIVNTGFAQCANICHSACKIPGEERRQMWEEGVLSQRDACPQHAATTTTTLRAKQRATSRNLYLCAA